MAAITNLSLTELKRCLEAGELSCREVWRAFHHAYLEDRSSPQPLNGYIEFFQDGEERAGQADKARASGSHGTLEGLPFAVKDNILVAGREASCGSAILRGFRAPYTATVVGRLLDQGAIPLGRTNMDEFAMGSSTEYSIYGPARNPVDRDKTPGGSSGGSAAVVAGGQAPCALGSDTGGSVRLPASFCGVYGLKPSYGTLSRYGLVAFGSSLDQIGILARTPDDIALILSVAAGRDPADETSRDVDFSRMFPLAKTALAGRRIAVPVELTGKAIDGEVSHVLDGFAGWLSDNGAEVKRVSVPCLSASVAIYYIIAAAEASSNLARFDGVRYGLRSGGSGTLEDMYVSTRSEGFGPEVKRRIFLGTYVLSSGYADKYYRKAMAVRDILQKELDTLLESSDFILSPTAPTPAFSIGEKIDDPLAMYLGDICTIYPNLALLPSISIPAGATSAGLPVGVQLTSKRFSEEMLLRVARLWHGRDSSPGAARAGKRPQGKRPTQKPPASKASAPRKAGAARPTTPRKAGQPPAPRKSGKGQPPAPRKAGPGPASKRKKPGSREAGQ
jgi:aspartyl-tRNA(Asn)/glutamyl-tRNA(Gln) amidotransferase subunit A